MFFPPTQGSCDAALSGGAADQYTPACIDFFGLGTPGVFPWSVNPPSDTAAQGAPAGQGGGATRGAMTTRMAAAASGSAAQNFTLSNSGTNHKIRVTASSSVAETHAPGHTRQAEQPSHEMVMRALMANPTPDNNNMQTAPANPTYISGLSFETSYVARAAVYEDTTRMGPQAAGGFLPSAIPVENQPFFGGPARTTVQGTGSSVGLQLNEALPPDVTQQLPVPVHNIGVYTNFVALNADNSSPGSPGVALQQAFIQIDNLVFGSMETAFADNDALPPTLDLAGPNARVSIMQTSSTVMGQGRLSYWLHQMPTDQASFGYAINASVEQPVPEIANNASAAKPAQPSTTFARFPDFIGTVKIGQMLEAPTDIPGDTSKEFYEAWHVQGGALVRSLGLEYGNNSIDESAFGWGLSLSGHYSWPVACNLLPDAIFGSVTYGVGIAHYISDLHSLSLTGAGNDAILDGDYLRPLAEFAYYAGYLHNWTDHWRSLLCYSHVTLDSQGQSNKTLYHYGDYASANIEWHRLVNGKSATNPMQTTTYDVHMGLEYIYGRFEELSGAAGQDQRISLVMAISK
ncbi:MAG TPA: hypothetical protein VHX68_19565 [Planctomycetaceae bacterium]|nr:hypothetical protein [Planctomycetaceae bacterium]